MKQPHNIRLFAQKCSRLLCWQSLDSATHQPPHVILNTCTPSSLPVDSLRFDSSFLSLGLLPLLCIHFCTLSSEQTWTSCVYELHTLCHATPFCVVLMHGSIALQLISHRDHLSAGQLARIQTIQRIGAWYFTGSVVIAVVQTGSMLSSVQTTEQIDASTTWQVATSVEPANYIQANGLLARLVSAGGGDCILTKRLAEEHARAAAIQANTTVE